MPARRYIPDVTLVCVDCVDAARAERSLRFCLAACRFDSVKLLTSRATAYEHAVTTRHVDSLEDYSNFIATELHLHVRTGHCLIVQHDGWICNGARWDDAWRAYDYVGGVSDWTEAGPDGLGGNGGFSLRSRALLQAGAVLARGRTSHPEDCVFSCNDAERNGRRWEFTAIGMRFAPRSIQEAFCQERTTWTGEFGHHQCNLDAWTPP